MAPGRRTRILIVDDSAVMRSLLRSVACADGSLEVAGTAADGQSALTAIETLRPNLILLDLNLSKYTGEDIIREIRNVAHLAAVPLCVWSSSRSRQDESQLKSLGVSRFIPKPSGLGQFMEIGKILKELLDAAKVGV